MLLTTFLLRHTIHNGCRMHTIYASRRFPALVLWTNLANDYPVKIAPVPDLCAFETAGVIFSDGK